MEAWRWISPAKITAQNKKQTIFRGSHKPIAKSKQIDWGDAVKNFYFSQFKFNLPLQIIIINTITSFAIYCNVISLPPVSDATARSSRVSAESGRKNSLTIDNFATETRVTRPFIGSGVTFFPKNILIFFHNNRSSHYASMSYPIPALLNPHSSSSLSSSWLIDRRSNVESGLHRIVFGKWCFFVDSLKKNIFKLNHIDWKSEITRCCYFNNYNYNIRKEMRPSSYSIHLSNAESRI